MSLAVDRTAELLNDVKELNKLSVRRDRDAQITYLKLCKAVYCYVSYCVNKNENLNVTRCVEGLSNILSRAYAAMWTIYTKGEAIVENKLNVMTVRNWAVQKLATIREDAIDNKLIKLINAGASNSDVMDHLESTGYEPKELKLAYLKDEKEGLRVFKQKMLAMQRAISTYSKLHYGGKSTLKLYLYDTSSDEVVLEV